MAKANVVARRIRAYERRLEEMTDRDGRPWHWVLPMEMERIRSRLEEGRAWMSAFLASRKKGPWAAPARVAV